MIIESISLNNFQCYYGSHEDNLFEFGDGLNLIVGNNGSGKSKLYDAFYWVLNDKVFWSDIREMVSTSRYKNRIVSDKAKALATPMTTVQCEVILIVSSDDDVKYRLTRSMNILKVGENDWENDDKSILKIDKYKQGRWMPEEEQHYSSIVDNRIMPDHMKKYMWFQGEEVDGLLEFSSKETLTNVIDLLSDISDFDKLSTIASNGSKKASSELRKAKAKQSKNQEKSEEIEREIGSLESNILYLKNQIDEADENIARSEEYIDKLISEVQSAQETQHKKDELRGIDSSLQKQKDRLDTLLEGVNHNLFARSWTLANHQKAFDVFTDKYNKYHGDHNYILSQKSGDPIKLPINVPAPIHVEEMLTEEKCYVCGRDAKKGTEEYEKIQSLLSRKQSDENKLFSNDCSIFFHRLYSSGLSVVSDVDNIDDEISEYLQEIRSVKMEISNLTDQISKIEKQYGSILNSSSSENIVRSYDQHKRNKESVGLELERHQKAYNASVTRLAQKKKDLDKQVVGSLSEVKVRSDQIYSNLSDIMSESRAVVFKDLVGELEEQANFFFTRMTKDNSSITGKISLYETSSGYYVPKIVGSDGVEMHSPNDSNIVLVKLSIIMAIIRSRGKFADNFSFISDSPTSKMASEYSNGFYKTLSQNFKQSIITTYDFCDSSDFSELQEFNIGSAYKIIPNFVSGDRNDRSSLSVSVKRVA